MISQWVTVLRNSRQCSFQIRMHSFLDWSGTTVSAYVWKHLFMWWCATDDMPQFLSVSWTDTCMIKYITISHKLKWNKNIMRLHTQATLYILFLTFYYCSKIQFHTNVGWWTKNRYKNLKTFKKCPCKEQPRLQVTTLSNIRSTK